MSKSTTVMDWQTEIHAWAKQRGWCEEFESWKDMGPEGFRLLAAHIAEKLALVHSEVSEALEELRTADNLEDVQRVWAGDKGKPEGFGVEMADVIIRVLQLNALLGIDTQKMLDLKADYNATRPYRHGKNM